jgi:hypothetical protein
MIWIRIFAAAMLCAAACTAESPVAGKWSCTNVQATGTESPWTLLVREDGARLAGTLTDGDVELPLSQMKLDGNAFTFRFYINGKPYTFEGQVDGRKLEGKFSGEEASGKLLCTR